MISASDKLHLARLAGTAHHLIGADAVWTEHVHKGRPEDVEAAGVAVRDLTTGLSSLRGEGAFLAQAATDVGDAGFERALAQSQLADHVLASVREKAQGGFVAAAHRHLGDIDKVVDRERGALEEEYARVRGGGKSAGDLSTACKCCIGWACLVSGSVLEAWPVAAAGIGLIAGNC